MSLVDTLTKNRPEAPVWLNGKQYLPSQLPKQSAKVQSSSLAGLSSHEIACRLTLARQGMLSPTKQKINESSTGGDGELIWGENGECLGWLSYE
ncbi:MAG: hypothetical protein Q8L15_07580 [Methylobacter sp.]|nr:hypothetical protein [Methylobacter sp.]